MLDENGFVILLENGSPQIEAVSEEVPSTNEELVSNQQIVQLPVMVEDFRFWTVARKYAFAVDNLEIKEEDEPGVQKYRKPGERRTVLYS